MSISPLRRVIPLLPESLATPPNARTPLTTTTLFTPFFAAARYDCIVLDLQMPVLGGLGAAQALSALARREGLWLPPMVALSANVSAEDRAACLAAGMRGHMVRPFAVRALNCMMSPRHQAPWRTLA